MRLILIRHGQTPSNVDGLLDTAVPGPALTDLGEQQAQAVVLVCEAVDAVFASTATRAQLTAAPLAAANNLDVQVIDGLHEVAAGDLEMAGDRESVHTYLGACAAWAAGDLGVRIPGGETGVDVLSRYDAAIEQATKSGAVVAVVSHGAIIRLWGGIRADNVPDDFGLVHPVSNTGVAILERTGLGPWQLLHWDSEPLGGSAFADPAHDGPAADIDS